VATRKKIEVFSAGCPACSETIEVVKRLAGSSHAVVVHDMNKSEVASKAGRYGVRSVPAVVIDGKLEGCCVGRGPMSKSCVLPLPLGTRVHEVAWSERENHNHCRPIALSGLRPDNLLPANLNSCELAASDPASGPSALAGGDSAQVGTE